ncbi:Hypothetical protein AJAP_42675 (plasmid) [Amycolatopsis japonica]|uniref:Uncharacterized protein n=1 Tax=Amycolatopsis japonica TaxID=208439 RepID=A0A075V4K1_9PSEU|nr:hypothetical protein [Amycolatopsis japonica]AIG81302.1 Hypothetical protein AJAP_42675 [Amycolatopsis japonica]
MPEDLSSVTAAVKRVTEAAKSRQGYYAPSKLVQAAKLLTALQHTGAEHGISPATWDYVTDLAGACVDAIHVGQGKQAPKTAAAAEALLGHVARTLAERELYGVQPEGQLSVLLPRVETTPAWGTNGDGQLAVSLSADIGWYLYIHDRARIGGSVRDKGVFAPFDAAGAAEVAEIAIQINRGPRDLFHR